MKQVVRFCLFILLMNGNRAFGQDSLPRINLINRAGSVIISWRNGYNKPVANIAIQRSYDSNRNFTTIGSVLNPQNTENGYADANPPYGRMFYRLFISFEGGRYTFSETRKPYKERNYNAIDDPEERRRLFQLDSLERVDAIRRADSLQRILNPKYKTWTPSRYVFTSRDNNVVINLDDAPQRKYSAKFFTADSVFIFEITKLQEPYLILEKVNFGHSGWFYFELYDNGILRERNKFYIPKDGKTSNSPTEINRKNKPGQFR